MTACRYTSCVLADSPASFMSSIIRVRIADIVCSFVIDGTTRLDADDSLTSYSSGDAATPPRLRHRRSRPFNKWFTRTVVAAAVIETLDALNLHYPKVSNE